MTAAAQRQSLAEKPDRHVVAAKAPFGGKSNLVRPVAIDRALAEFSFAVDHIVLRGGLPADPNAYTRVGTKREHHEIMEVSAMSNSLDELRTMARDVEREGWWLNGALHA